MSDQFLNELLSTTFPNKGTFVEIGAYDGETYSKTCHLADDGWKGFYFEPVLEFAYRCKNRHQNNKVYVLPVAIGYAGIKTFYQSDLISTFGDKKYRDKVTQLEWFKGRKFTETVVASLPPSVIPECDLLVIDTEGDELTILKGLKIRPKIIVVELHEKSKDWQRIVGKSTRECLSILKDMGYTKVYADDIDSIFTYAI